MLDILGEDALAVWIDAKVDNNEAALLWLCEQGDAKTLEILLKGLQDLSIDDEQARKLLEVRNSNGQNAIDIARQAGHQDIVKLFETYLSS
jgi:ankyrin repeat protein